MAWSPPKTWGVGNVLTAAELNTYVRDNQNAIGKFQTYTPSWGVSGGTAPTIGNGFITGRYLYLEEWVWVQILIAAGSTTTAGSGQYQLTLPVGAAMLQQSYDETLFGTLNDLGNARYMTCGSILGAGSSLVVNGIGPWPSGGTSQNWTNSTPFAFGNGDTMNLSGFYRRY